MQIFVWHYRDKILSQNNIFMCGSLPTTSLPIFHNKIVFQLSKLREELIRTKNIADDERIKREKNEEKLKELEEKLNGISSDAVVRNLKIFFNCSTI